MTLFSLLSGSKVLKPPGKGKVISSKDFSTLVKATKILEKVKKEAEEYRKQVVSEGEELKGSASQEGFVEGLEKFNELTLELNEKIGEIHKEVTAKIIPVAVKAAKKILGEELKLNPESIVAIVMQTLKAVTQHHTIKIYVNKADLERVEAKKSKIKEILEQVESLSILEGRDVKEGGCIIETERGIIDAQLDTQWRALEKAFKAFTATQEGEFLPKPSTPSSS